MEIKFSFEELEIQRTIRKFVRDDLLPIAREVDGGKDFFLDAAVLKLLV